MFATVYRSSSVLALPHCTYYNTRKHTCSLQYNLGKNTMSTPYETWIQFNSRERKSCQNMHHLSLAQTLHISIVMFQALFKERARACRCHGNARSRRPNFPTRLIISNLYIFSSSFFFYFLHLFLQNIATLLYSPFKSSRHQCRVTHLIRIQKRTSKNSFKGFGGYRQRHHRTDPTGISESRCFQRPTSSSHRNDPRRRPKR